MKRWLIPILLIIIAAGTFVPCCQIDSCAADQVSSSQANGDNDTEGMCSPFFSCGSCASFIELTKPMWLNRPLFQKIVHYKKMEVHNLSNYSASFWQPPRS